MSLNEKFQINLDGEVDVVICIHNALADVIECLDSVVLNSENYNLILVDDCSDSPTEEYLNNFSQKNNCKLVVNRKRLGYVKSANMGLRASKGDLIVLLNSDTIVSSNWINKMKEAFDEGAGIVGPLSNCATWQSIPTVRIDNDWANNDLPESYNVEDFSRIVELSSEKRFPNVPVVNGFCIMISRAVITEIGYFDEDAFEDGYGEENDYCLRATKSGFRVRIADNCYIYHKKSKSYREKRKELSKKAQEELEKKYSYGELKEISSYLNKNEVLYRIRKRIQYFYDFNLKLPQKRNKFLFLMLCNPGSGGVNSVVQEVCGLRKLGFYSEIAIHKKNAEKFLNFYGNEHIFFFYNNAEQLSEYSKRYDVCIATVFYSVFLLKEILEKNNRIKPAYYIQDYEPFFFKNDSDHFRLARQSYHEIKNALLFAKTSWLVNLLNREENILLKRILPSLDQTIFFPTQDKVMCSDKIKVCAMIRPHALRRNPEKTMKILKDIKGKYGKDIEVHTFGCNDSEFGFYSLENDFIFINHGVLTRNEVGDLLRKCDIFIDLSVYQAFGRTGLEAMGCGAAVILPNEGGIYEYAENNINCLIVDTKSNSDILSALDNLIQNKNLRQEIRKNALETALKFSIANSVVSEVNALSS